MNTDTAPTHDVYVRLTVKRTVIGTVTPDKKHKAVRAARAAFKSHKSCTVVAAEVAHVQVRE